MLRVGVGVGQGATSPQQGFRGWQEVAALHEDRAWRCHTGLAVSQGAQQCHTGRADVVQGVQALHGVH